MLRDPEPLRTVTEPPTASSAAGMSACGSAWASEPPIVPRLRTAGEPMPAAAWATARAPRSTSGGGGDGAVARHRADHDLVASCRMPVSSSMPARSTSASGEASRSRIIGTSDWPPAIGFAPSRSACQRLVDGVARV
jgi:hypothetical protein